MLYTKKNEAEKNEDFKGVVQPVDAATVILIREDGQKPFEVFLMRRHRNQSFMAGAFVFPGGRLDKTDLDPELSKVSKNIIPDCALTLNEPDLPEKTALGLYFTAIRETFEESRVLLAEAAEGTTIHSTDNKHLDQLEIYRKQIHSKTLSLVQLAEKENICYSLDLLSPCSRWITPEIERMRFDTRFFLARMPKGQRPAHDAIEMTESLWLTPDDALRRQHAGKLPLMPPTVKTIEELAGFSSIDHLFSTVPARDIYPILPQAVPENDGFFFKLPHDPEYTIQDFKQPPRPDDPSRIVMTEGIWKPVLFKNA